MTFKAHSFTLGSLPRLKAIKLPKVAALKLGKPPKIAAQAHPLPATGTLRLLRLPLSKVQVGRGY